MAAGHCITSNSTNSIFSQSLINIEKQGLTADIVHDSAWFCSLCSRKCRRTLQAPDTHDKCGANTEKQNKRFKYIY